VGKRIAIKLPATGDTEKTEVRNSGRKQEGRKGETSFRQRRQGGGAAVAEAVHRRLLGGGAWLQSAAATAAAASVQADRGAIVVPLGWIIAMRCW
jgi:hypothetical protein